MSGLILLDKGKSKLFQRGLPKLYKPPKKTNKIYFFFFPIKSISLDFRVSAISDASKYNWKLKNVRGVSRE